MYAVPVVPNVVPKSPDPVVPPRSPGVVPAERVIVVDLHRRRRTQVSESRRGASAFVTLFKPGPPAPRQVQPHPPTRRPMVAPYFFLDGRGTEHFGLGDFSIVSKSVPSE